MRQQIDCAVLALSTHRPWLDSALKQVEPAMARIRLHYLDWESQSQSQSQSQLQSRLQSDPAPQTPVDTNVNVDIQAFAQASVSLRRFDVCLLPVSLETLGWTRQALAAIPRGPFIPIIGVLRGLRSAAMQDLLELGLADFVRLPLCPDEYRARILSTVSKVPRHGTSLREPELGYGAMGSGMQSNGYVSALSTGRQSIGTPHKNQVKQMKSNTRLMLNQSGGQVRNKNVTIQNESFRASKAKVVEEFERAYITRTLERHDGNIAQAARASEKHRRAFWALMRKYQIDAGPYRPDDDAE